MKQGVGVLLLLTGLILITQCGTDKELKPVPRPRQMAGYAYDYVYKGVEWINRDFWECDDGTTRHSFSVSYNLYEKDWWADFAYKLDTSRVPNQTRWSQYTSYRPGGRSTDDSSAYPWAGTYCMALVYRSAVKAGYSIPSGYLYCIDRWENLGTEVIAPEEGDLILLDFDSTNNDVRRYEHLGVMWGGLLHILSAVGIYSSPFGFKAGIHTRQDYEDVLPVEFEPYLPPGHPGYDVYNYLYVRLSE